MPRLRSITNSSDTTGRDEHPDIRTWEVRTRVDGARAGVVHDVLVDDSGEPRYIDVAMTDGKHVLMPRSEVRVSDHEQVIDVPGLDRDAMATLPEYDHDPESITPEYTREHRGIYQKVYRPPTTEGSEMAYEEPERRSRVRGGGWLWGLLVVLALALIIWWLWPQTADVEPVDVEPDISLIAPPELIQTTL